MEKHRGSHLPVMALPAWLYLIVVSLYLSPSFQGIGIENDFKDYYLAYASGKRDIEQFYQWKIHRYIDLIDLRVTRNSDAPLAKYIWIGMFSGNENISLTSGSIHFSYLIKNNKSTSLLTLVLASMLYTAFLLVGIQGICHNLLTYATRLHVFPTKSYLRYAVQYFRDLGVKDKEEVPLKGYIKALFAYIPGWLIGLSIGYINGDYNVYVKSPIVSIYLFIFTHLYCVCAGSILILTLNQMILFLFMRIDVDIITTYIDDIICAVVSIVISIWIFNNGLGTTVAVTSATLFYTIVINNISRAVSTEEYESTSLAAVGYSNLGLSYHKQNKIDNAVKMYRKAISVYTKLGRLDDCAPIYALLGKVYFDNGDLQLAEDALNKALSIYRSRTGAQEAIDTTNALLDLISERRQGHSEANQYMNTEYGK